MSPIGTHIMMMAFYYILFLSLSKNSLVKSLYINSLIVKIICQKMCGYTGIYETERYSEKYYSGIISQ